MKCGSSKDSSNQDKNAPNSHCAFEDLDHSVLQQPLNLGVTNVKQILKCIQSGSREIKDIILNECNIIYECKVCLGLFRSLANFLYHKRCYCKKHLCEDMVLFEKFEEADTIIVQPEPPKEKSDKETKTQEEVKKMSKITECTVDLVQADIPEEMNVDASKEIKSKTETSDNTKKMDNKKEASSVKDTQDNEPEIIDITQDKPSVTSNSKNKVKLASEPEKTESPMISRRTRDKNAHNPVCATKVAVKASAPEEPPLKCAKIITAKIIRKESNEKSPSSDSKKDTRVDLSNKEVKTKKIELSKLTGALDKRNPSFPKIIFKTIDSTPHAVYQSNDKKKLETFGVSRKYETSTVQTKVDNDKLIIVLKKDVKSDNSSDSKTSESKRQSEAEKVSDFHLTRRKRLMARNDCNVHELKCLTCKTQFMSLKTLYFHMLSLHSKKRLYYPCPFCKTLFVQMYGVTRHLISIHNKSKDQINKLREVIKKKSVWKRVDDVNPSFDSTVSPINYQIKTDPPPEKKIETIEAVQNDNAVAETEPLKTIIKVGKNVTLHQCAKCNRVFGRKSSQVSHQKFCIMNAVKTDQSDSSPQVQQNPPVVSFLSLSPKPVSPTKPSSAISINKSEYNPPKAIQVDKQNSGDVKVSIRPKRGAEKQMHKDFVNSQTLKWRSANRIDTNANTKTSPIKKANGKNLEKKVLSIMNPENLTCLKCDKKFSSYSNLRRHVAIHVGWTRFKCKYCEYQAYNKSQCWAHVQKSHSVDETDMEKSIVNLLNSAQSTSKKTVTQSAGPVSNPKRANETPVKTLTIKTNSIPKVKISKKKNTVHAKSVNPEKKQLQIQKKEGQEVRKESEKEPERETADSKKEKSQMVIPPQKLPKKDVTDVRKEKEKSQMVIPPQKLPKKDVTDVRKEKILPTISFQKFQKKEIIENKKDKPQHIIPIQKLTIPDYKRETNYKSVTTSNPTTIILSKKIPSSTVQSIMTISPESMSSTSKISPIRTSPRKNEIKGPGERLITTLVTRSSAYTKNTPIQIKLPPRSNSVDEISKDSIDKNCSKKERLISEWFPKRDASSANVRRESAPLIIGLVPAVNAGLNARAKSSSAAGEKSDS